MTTTPIEPQAAANTDEPLSSSELANKLDALYKIIRDNGNELSWSDPDRIKAMMKRAWELAAVLRISASRLRTTPAASQHSDLAGPWGLELLQSGSIGIGLARANGALDDVYYFDDAEGYSDEAKAESLERAQLVVNAVNAALTQGKPDHG